MLFEQQHVFYSLISAANDGSKSEGRGEGVMGVTFFAQSLSVCHVIMLQILAPLQMYFCQSKFLFYIMTGP